jgi:hypothetical protein
MNELVYKLNLPPFDEILLPDVFDKLMESNNTYKHYKSVDLIKTEFLKINGILLDGGTIFIKNNFAGSIHSDKDSKRRNPWGINWIWNGTGFLDYWHPEDIDKTENLIDPRGIPYDVHTTSKPPFKRYSTIHGCAYLVNAETAHQATGVEKRYALCLRATNLQNMPWEEVVEKFKPLIINTID